MWPKGGGKSTQAIRFVRSEEGKGALNALLVCILAGMIIGMIFPYFHTTVRKAKEAALRGGLVNIRKTIQLYHFTEHRYPPDLESLVHKQRMSPKREDTFYTEEYLSAVTADGEGHLLDPFGNRYRYDPRTGTVFSRTSGYETW